MREDAVRTENSNFQGKTQQYTVAKQATGMLHRCRCKNTQNQHSQCKVHKTLMTNLIVGQCMLYVVQIEYAAYVTICRGLPNVKVPCTYLWMISRMIVGLPTPLIMYYLVASYIYWG